MPVVTHWLVASLLVTVAGSAISQVTVNINVPGVVQMAPPAPRYEAMPRPRSGQVWVPGHWAWDNRDYRWRAGQWKPARADQVYDPGRWVQADGGWRWNDGGWRHSDGRPEHRDRWDDRDHRQARGHRDEPGPGHCPPGQAKKGRC